MPDGTPLYQRQLRLLRAVFPEPHTIYISLAPGSETDDYLESLLAVESDPTPENESENGDLKEPKVRILRDRHPPRSRYSAGPAAGLLSAYRYDPWATWVVVNCDYPLLPPDAIYHLMVKRDSVPVTCYRSTDGDCEPLLAIWAPPAMARLAERVARGHPCPKEAAREFDALTLDAPPGCEWWLTNVDEMEELVKTIEEKKLRSLEPAAVEVPKEAA
ncbi:molybdopterin-guanine dinucleotide biosynthesis protein a [Colletotrichum karsti]|uniref:Molybdopterin-guanine dinucleotide biosynthesis protein a n=1 Tax=Colletotrichum karsti TaxID=1095194 RepID=A0A9P6LI21_9PEZI|nr:molybdopterin-guanine dinucleotide biosynthesis protein a [Colletotrichum karsti]KAF9876884.1 molybdopterin-guanine dinucleotide biosynthesis protein a [Colletotrichum karsti]